MKDRHDPHRKNEINFDNITIIHLEIEITDTMRRIADCIIREMILKEVIDVDYLQELYMQYDDRRAQYTPKNFHITMFRIKKTTYINLRGEEENCDFKRIFDQFGDKEIGDFKAHHIEISQFY